LRWPNGNGCVAGKNHWIFTAKYTDQEKETLKLFNPNSVAFMNLEQKAALYKSKKLREIDPKTKLYDAMVHT
jgi:hypothetical protein